MVNKMREENVTIIMKNQITKTFCNGRVSLLMFKKEMGSILNK